MALQLFTSCSWATRAAAPQHRRVGHCRRTVTDPSDSSTHQPAFASVFLRTCASQEPVSYTHLRAHETSAHL
eukprot:6721877-Alexandrium_andersonii.AAC.1